MQRNENSFIAHCLENLLWRNPARSINSDAAALKSVRFQELDRPQYGWMFNRARDYVIAAPSIRFGQPFDREIRRFSAARGKDNFLRRRRINQFSNLSSGLTDRIPRAESARVHRPGACEILRKEGKHRFPRFSKKRGRCGMIEINLAFRHSSRPYCPDGLRSTRA